MKTNRMLSADRMWRAAALVLALVPALAMAQVDTKTETAKREELAKARAAMDAARQKVRELSTELGESEPGVRVHHFSSKRPMLGFVLDINEAKGVRLAAITPDGPAARAGLRSGDVLTVIDGKRIEGEHAAQRIGDAQRRLGRLQEGQTVALAYEREGVPANVTVKAEALAPLAYLRGLDALGARSLRSLADLDIDLDGVDIQIEQALKGLKSIDGANVDIDVEQVMDGVQKRIRVIGPMLEETVRFDAWRWQGLRMAPLDADLGRYFGAQQGVLVLKADNDAMGGLRSGDVIQTIDGAVVADPGDAMQHLTRADPGQRMVLGILRDKRLQSISLVAPEQPDMARLFQIPEPPSPPTPPAPPAPPTRQAAPPPPPAPPPPSGRGIAI